MKLFLLHVLLSSIQSVFCPDMYSNPYKGLPLFNVHAINSSPKGARQREGGSKLIKNSVTYFMDSPFLQLELELDLWCVSA